MNRRGRDTVRRIRAGQLEIAFAEHGPEEGPPVVLMHGYPDDIHAWDGVAPALAAAGLRVIVPYLRGYGPTRFLDDATPRSGEQAALGADLLALLDALAIPSALLAGYDWGGRACCVVAALWPERVRGLVTVGGYNVQNIARAEAPADPAQELRYWYQWYFCTPRGEAGLAANRAELHRLLWRLWSPNYDFDDTTFAETAASFDNPDHVAVVIHSYRHRYGWVAGDPAHAPVEALLARQPPITVPSIVLEGAADGVTPVAPPGAHARRFTSLRGHHVLDGIGHFLPREAPEAVVAALTALHATLS
jgi:pimeloyl-ACP methyl ester carboxylesterase